MSLLQSNIDWARYMEGLQGKANLDLNNMADKLADSFISKFMLDETAGINFPITMDNKSVPVSGYLVTSFDMKSSIERYLFINDIKIYTSVFNATARVTIPLLVEKGSQVRGVNWYEEATLYPLKGAN